MAKRRLEAIEIRIILPSGKVGAIKVLLQTLLSTLGLEYTLGSRYWGTTEEEVK